MADVNKEIALKVTTDVGQTNTALKSAEERLGEAKKAMLDLAMAGKQGSKEFRDLAVEAGALKGKIESVEQTVDGLSKTTNKIEVFSGAVQGIAAGFAVAQGTAALFAEGNEELQEALVKVQASMALLQGTEQAVQLLRKESAAGQAILIGLQKAYAIAVNIATAATRSFSAALAATGVGALVVGLGFLIAKLMETSAATKQSNLDLEEAAKKQKQLGDEIALTNKLRQSEIDLAAAAGASAKTTALEKIALTRGNIVEKQKEIDAEQKLIDQIEANKNKVIDAQKAILDVLIKQKQDKKTLLQAELNDLNAKLQTEKSVIKEADAIDAEANAKLRERMRLANMEFIDLQAKKIQSVRDTNATELQINKDGLAAQLKIEQEARDIQEAKQKEYNANKLADQQAVENGIKEMIRGSFQSIADISAAFAGDNEERQRKAFEIQKVAAIAGTVIDTYSAAQAAFKSASQIPIIGAVAGPIAAAAAIAAGLARVAAIKRTEFKAASSSAAPQAVRPAGLPQGGQQPPAAFTPNVTNPNPTGQPNPQGGQNGTTRVIVVESDIRRVTTRVDAAERFATFG
jgi:chromosome segregation ATPase